MAQITFTVEVPAADELPFRNFVELMANCMRDGVGKGYSPELSTFIHNAIPGCRQFWQADEAIAKTIRGCCKLLAGDRGATSDFVKVACAVYTTVRDFGQ